MVEISTLADDGLIGTEVTVGGNPATRAIKKLNAFKLTVDDTVFVDGVNGDDANGLRERPDKPFKTLAAAFAAAVANDTVEVLPAVYDEIVAGAKNLIWNFHQGASMNYTGGTNAPLIECPSSGVFEVRGFGSFSTVAGSCFSLFTNSATSRVVLEADTLTCITAQSSSNAILAISFNGPIEVRVNKVVSTTTDSAVSLSGSETRFYCNTVAYTGTGTAVSMNSSAYFYCSSIITSSAGDGITLLGTGDVDFPGVCSLAGAGKCPLKIGTDSSSLGAVVTCMGVLASSGGNGVEILNGGATVRINRLTSLATGVLMSTASTNYTVLSVLRLTAPTGVSATAGRLTFDCATATCSSQFIVNDGATLNVVNNNVTSPAIVFQTAGTINGRFNVVSCSGTGVYITQGTSSLTFDDLIVTGAYAATWPDTLDGNHVLKAKNLSGPSGAVSVSDPFGSAYLVDVDVAATISSAGTVIHASSTRVNVRADTISGGRIAARSGSEVNIDANTIESLVTASGNAVLTVRNANIAVSGQIPVQLPNGEGDGQRLNLIDVVVDGGTNVCFLGEGNNTAIFRNTVLVSSSGTVAAGSGDAYYYGVYANGVTASTLTVPVDDSVVSASVIG